MKFTKLIPVLAFAFLATTFAAPSYAEHYGLATGRTASLDDAADLSAEVGLSLGTTLLGTRVNYKLTPDLLVYGDVGRYDDGGFDGFVFGLGAMYQLRGVELLANTDLAVRGSYHGGTLDCDIFGFEFAGCDRSASEFAVNAIVSGSQVGSSDLAWYGSAGLNVLDFGTRVGVGAGVVGSLGFGEWYAALEYAGTSFLALGIRYNFGN